MLPLCVFSCIRCVCMCLVVCILRMRVSYVCESDYVCYFYAFDSVNARRGKKKYMQNCEWIHRKST